MERASGLKYKSLWAKMDKAKKALKAEGFDFDAPAETSPQKAAVGKKRKAKGEAGDDGQVEVSPIKKGKKSAVKAENEAIGDGVKEEDSD